MDHRTQYLCQIFQVSHQFSGEVLCVTLPERALTESSDASSSGQYLVGTPPIDRFQTYDGDMFLVESQGNIPLVCIRKPWHVDLFRLDLKNKAWIRIDNLDDQALFLNDDHMISVSASEAECRGNYMYSTYACSNYAAHVYHIENRSIRSVVRMGERRRRPRKHQVWITPSLS